MRSALALFLILFIFCSCEDSDPAVTPKPTQVGLIAFYDFEGDAVDKVGEHDGIENNIFYGPVSKENMLGAEFFGVEGGSYIDLTNPFDLENKTISFWFLAKEIPEAGALVYTSDNTDLQFGLSVFSVKTVDSEPNFYFNYSNALASHSIETYRWYHVAGTLDGKDCRYYLDGELISSTSFLEYMKSGNGHDAAIVGASRIMDRNFNGLVDDLRIYNRALTTEEIKVLAMP